MIYKVGLPVIVVVLVSSGPRLDINVVYLHSCELGRGDGRGWEVRQGTRAHVVSTLPNILCPGESGCIIFGSLHQ